jgi:hypothetical protein
VPVIHLETVIHARPQRKHRVVAGPWADRLGSSTAARGIGSQLLSALLERATAEGHHALVAGTDGDNHG